jgi:hypothetical protein
MLRKTQPPDRRSLNDNSMHQPARLDVILSAIIDSAIGRANEVERSAESGSDEYRQQDLALDLISELLWHDASGTVAELLVSRITKMRLRVHLSLMRDAVEIVDRHTAPLVIHLLAATMAALRWDGHGWLEDIPKPESEQFEVAANAFVNTLMVIDDDWGDPEILDLLPLLSCNEQPVRRAAWIALRCVDSMWHAPMVVAAVSAGLSSADSAARSHAAYIAEDPQRRLDRARRPSS